MIVGPSFIQLNPIELLQKHIYKFSSGYLLQMYKYKCVLKSFNNTFVSLIVVTGNISLPNYLARTLPALT